MRRKCTVCGGENPGKPVFPYCTYFNNKQFDYLKCSRCSSVYVDPVPDDRTLALMYLKESYHDQHYNHQTDQEYLDSCQLLRKFLDKYSLVLDYGCGLGHFLEGIKANSLSPFGVDFDEEAAKVASKRTDTLVLTVHEFEKMKNKPIFDAIHLGDVLEHLKEPSDTLNQLLQLLRPGGILFVEGPLERNPSLVYFSSRMFGGIKKLMFSNYGGEHPPYHLFQLNAKQQIEFFNNLDANLTMKVWSIYETGWPYKGGNLIKRIISELSILISKSIDFNFGNRFKAIFIKSQERF